MSDSAPITAAEYVALAEFRYHIRRFLHFSEQAARGAGIEPHQHQFLLAVKGLTHAEQAPTLGNVAERLQIQHHSAVELADRLEGKGLVARSRASADRRQVLLHLTRRGEKELEKLSMCHLTELKNNGPALVTALKALTRRLPGPTRRLPRRIDAGK